MLRLLLFILLLPIAGLAEQVPAAQISVVLFDVIDVESDDVLNIRAGPTASEPIIGGFAYNAKRIEILALNDRATWGKVSQLGIEGWVYLRYLGETKTASEQTMGQDQSIYCTGETPVWTLDIFGESAQFSQSGVAAPVSLSIEWSDESPLADLSQRVFMAEGKSGALSGIIRQEQCTILQTENPTDYSISLILSEDGHSFISGCCRLRE